jgi:hypothetical protein
MDLMADVSYDFNSPADTDITLNFTATTSSGVLKWMEDEDYFQYSDGLLMSTAEEIFFRDTAIHIKSGDDGHLDLTADTSIDMNGDIDIADTKNIILATGTGTKIGTATTQKLGFYNAPPVVQPAEMTDELTSITHTAPSSPDYALQDLVQNTGFGFATADEGNTVLSVILNLQTRVNELEAKLVSLGLLADAD